MNFYIGNGPEADGTFVRAMGIEPSIRGQWLEAPNVAQRSRGAGRSRPSETSAFFRDRALAWIRDSSMAQKRDCSSRKTWLALSGAFLTLNHSYPVLRHDTGPRSAFLVVGPALIVPLGALGLLFARPRRATDF